jgi:DNA polymerase V
MNKIFHTNISSISPVSIDSKDVLYPLYSSQPSAGFPAPGDDLVEQPLNLNDLLVENETATFFVKVSGDSMEGARIFDGDILVVDRSIEAVSGRIVVAAVYGELVVKRLKVKNSQLLLLSENDDYNPIEISDVEGCFVWGVVTGSVRVIL